MYVQLCNSTEIKLTPPLRTYSLLFQVVCLYSHPSQQIKSTRVFWVTWLGLSLSSCPEKILLHEYILTRHCSTHGSTAPSVKTVVFAVLFIASPLVLQKYCFKIQAGNGNVTGGLVLTLSFQALSKHFCLNFETDLMSALWVSFALTLLCKCLYSSNFFNQDWVWSFPKRAITSQSSSGVCVQEWEE